MNKDIELLDYIYQNAEMGLVGIDSIIEKVSDENLEQLILEQREEYKTIMEEAKEIYKKYGKDENELSKLTKLSSNIMTEMMMITKKGETNLIAKMMIEGSNKGIIAITEKINNIETTDKEIKELAQKLLRTEQHNLDELKKYL